MQAGLPEHCRKWQVPRTVCGGCNNPTSHPYKRPHSTRSTQTGASSVTTWHHVQWPASARLIHAPNHAAICGAVTLQPQCPCPRWRHGVCVRAPRSLDPVLRLRRRRLRASVESATSGGASACKAKRCKDDSRAAGRAASRTCASWFAAALAAMASLPLH